MNTYIITYNLKYKTDGRKVRTRTYFGRAVKVEAPSVDVAKANFLSEKVLPWEICKTITKIEEAI